MATGDGTYGGGSFGNIVDGGGGGGGGVPFDIESVSIDGLEVNNGDPWTVLGDPPPIFTTAKKKLNWITNPQTDGSVLAGDVERHYENASWEMTLGMDPQPNEDTALNVLHALIARLQRADQIRGGIPVIWNPSNATNSITFYAIEAEIAELPITRQSGWFTQQLSAPIRLDLRPFGYGPEARATLGYTEEFLYSGTVGRWRFDQGWNQLGRLNGSLTPTTTGVKRIYVADGYSDLKILARVQTGTSSTGGIGVIAKRVDPITPTLNGNYLRGVIDVASGGTIKIEKVDTGTAATLATDGFSTAASTWYWLELLVTGDDLELNLYEEVAEGIRNAVPVANATYTLTGADQVKFGTGIRGGTGVWVNAVDNAFLTDVIHVSAAPNVTSSEPATEFEVAAPDGDVNAEGRLIVHETSSQNRAHCEWGVEHRSYDPEDTPPLLIDSQALVTTGFAGSQVVLSGSFDPYPDATNNSITASPLSATTSLAVCGTPNLRHVGAYKIRVRARTDQTGVRCRLAWRFGKGRYTKNRYSEPLIAGQYRDVDLGSIIIPEAGVGTQVWDGKIEAFGVSGAGIWVDFLVLIPQERYGISRTPLQPISADTYTALDSFRQGSATMDNTAVLDVGGGDAKWHLAGAGTGTGDWSINTTSHFAQRSKVSDASQYTGRFALVGTTGAAPDYSGAATTPNYTAIQVQCDMVGDDPANVDLTDKYVWGVVARYVDVNNWVMAVRYGKSVPFGGGFIPAGQFKVLKRKAGTVTTLGSIEANDQPLDYKTMILSIDAAGLWQAFFFDAGGKQPAQPQLQGIDSDLSTGNVLQSGKIGMYDSWALANAVTRVYDNFTAFSGVTESVLYSGRELHIRSDRTERQDPTTDTLFGRVPNKGQRFFVAPSGTDGRQSRVLAKLRRVDVDNPGLPNQFIQDGATYEVFLTPRYLAPR